MKMAIVFLALSSVSGSLFARSIDALTEALDRKKEAFAHRQLAAEEWVLQQFDTAIAKARRTKGASAVDRVSLAKLLMQQREQFETRGIWPNAPHVANVAYSYAKRLQCAYRSVSKAYDQLIQSHLSADDPIEAERLTDEKLSFERLVLPGRGNFATGSHWRGTRSSDQHNTRVHFNVDVFSGSLFKGTVHQNPKVAGHTVYEIEGRVDGMHVRGRSTKVIHGDARGLTFDGFVLGNHLVLRVGGSGSKGRRIGREIAVLSR